MRQLNSASLPAVAREVPLPGYDRSRLEVGIVHVGLGGFARSHLAMYLDRLMSAGSTHDWGVCGVGLLPGDRRMQEVMQEQDCLYTLVLKHPDGTSEPRVVGSVVEYLFAPDDPDAVVERMAAPTTRIVSLTITEGGYEVPSKSTSTPTPSVFDLVTDSLLRRRDRGLEPFTVMSCDNIQGNGEVARKTFVAFAETFRDPQVARWMDTEVSFPSSMVDRITPVTSDADREAVAEGLGVRDEWPVVAEPFAQWVIEDRFPAGRPQLEDVGVQLVEDVEPYELMKLRLLNAGHQVVAYLGHLAGYRYVHEVCADPLFARFLLGYFDYEATPTLSPVPGVDLVEYKRTLVERFANPAVADSLARICAYTSDRIPTFLLPVVRHRLAHGGDVRRSALAVAGWARYAEGVDDNGQPHEVVDSLRERLAAVAARQRQDPTAFIADRELFGELVDSEQFVSAYTVALRSLHAHGARATVEQLERDPAPG